MNPRTIPPAIGAVLCCAALLPAAEGANLCFNSGIETAGNNNPPPGWTMWGAQKYKDPANFTRETNNPHAGQACLRIHHPKQTAGYIVSAPDHGVKTEKGQCYAVTFWARAAKAGKSVFGLDGYATIKPLTGAPSPGFFSFDVTPEWKQFTFEVHEGWDFFASKTPFFLLVFKATREEPEEQTLFIDDVAVTAAKSTRDGRLLEREELNVPPLEHRLARGDKLAFAVDTTKKLRRATREAGGISFHRVAGWTGVPYDKQGQYVLPPKLEEAVRDLRLPMTRFYAVGAEQFSLEDGIDKAAALCKRVGIPLETTVLEFETQGATSVLPPDTWASGVRYARERQYGFHRWEITNEPYVGSAKVMFPLPEKYAEHFLAVSKAVRQAQPECQIGLSIHGRSTGWGDYLLKRCAGQYDFVVPHWYCFLDVNKHSPEDAILRGNAETLDELLRVNALIRAYNPGREVYQYDTEWGMHSGGAGGERADHVIRNGNIVGALHRAVRLIYYTREEFLRGASSWEMFTRSRAPGFAILTPDAPDKRGMIYWLYYHFNRHVGDSVVHIAGTAPYHEWTVAQSPVAQSAGLRPPACSMPMTPVLATLSADEKTLYLVIVNASFTAAAPCEIALKGFAAASATAKALSQDGPDANPMVAQESDVVSALPVTIAGETLKCTIPPHAAVFVTVTGR